MGEGGAIDPQTQKKLQKFINNASLKRLPMGVSGMWNGIVCDGATREWIILVSKRFALAIGELPKGYDHKYTLFAYRF